MKTILCAVFFSFALSLLFCLSAIPLLKRMGGQHILVYVKEHEQKEGTPTMGGLAFILAAVIAALVFVRGADRPFWVAIAVGLGYLIVGFLDDFLKKQRGNNLGLRAYQKILFQLGVAVIASVFCCLEGFTVVRIPYTQLSFDIGWWMLPLGIFVFVATVNGVNLTDGLDGLAGGTSAVFFCSACRRAVTRCRSCVCALRVRWLPIFCSIQAAPLCSWGTPVRSRSADSPRLSHSSPEMRS